MPGHWPWGGSFDNLRGIPYARVIPLAPLCQLSLKGEVSCADLQKLEVPHYSRFSLVYGFEPAKPGLVAFLGTDSGWNKVRPDWTSSLLTYLVNKLFGREPAERRVNSVFGIFLLKEGAAPFLIIRGYSSVFSVSPDGCTVAAYTHPGLYGPHQTSISHICAEEPMSLKTHSLLSATDFPLKSTARARFSRNRRFWRGKLQLMRKSWVKVAAYA